MDIHVLFNETSWGYMKREAYHAFNDVFFALSFTKPNSLILRGRMSYYIYRMTLRVLRNCIVCMET